LDQRFRVIGERQALVGKMRDEEFMDVAKRRGMRRAVVAVARKLAIVMHRIWSDGAEFRWTREEAAA